jgi:hypothetical protein
VNESQASAATRAGGSEKRQRVHKVDTRWDGIEHAALVAAAQTAGLAKGGYIRALVLGCPGPRARRAPPVNAELLARAVAQLHRAGNNLNQIARLLNAAQAAGTRESLEALAETRAAVARIVEAVGRDGP